ncbi:KTSC domain-containing protein [Nostoc sp.]|uniref:KTSC domain-containing protein n=1 Tax=Nostoc sp. TaxID=1180 RepID=UPI002FF8411D
MNTVKRAVRKRNYTDKTHFRGLQKSYLGVDENTWEDLHSSDSIGSFFNQEIKGK